MPEGRKKGGESTSPFSDQWSALTSTCKNINISREYFPQQVIRIYNP